MAEAAEFLIAAAYSHSRHRICSEARRTASPTFAAGNMCRLTHLVELLHALLELSFREMPRRKPARYERAVYQLLTKFCGVRKPIANVCPLVRFGTTRVYAEVMEMALKIEACETGAFFAVQAGETTPGERLQLVGTAFLL